MKLKQCICVIFAATCFMNFFIPSQALSETGSAKETSPHKKKKFVSASTSSHSSETVTQPAATVETASPQVQTTSVTHNNAEKPEVKDTHEDVVQEADKEEQTLPQSELQEKDGEDKKSGQ